MHHQYMIIGGGVHGCAAAWELASAGGDVLLLEAEAVASGASGGFGRRGVRGNRRDLREVPLMRDAHRRWPVLADRLEGPTGFVRTGGLHLIEQETTGTRGGRVAAHTHAAVQSRLGLPTEVLDRESLLEYEPTIGPGIRAALLSPLDGTADHGATTRSYAAAAREHGATLAEGVRAASVERSGGRVTAVSTDAGDRITVGEALLILNNTGAPELLRSGFGVEAPIWRILPQALRMTGDGLPALSHLIGHDHRSLAMKALDDGSLMISGGWRGRWDAASGRGATVPEQVEGNLGAASAVFPALHGRTPAAAEAGAAESCSADEIPVIDRVPGAENAWVATGWTGHGFAIAPAVAPALADWVRSGVRPSVLAPFAFDRFGPAAPAPLPLG